MTSVHPTDLKPALPQRPGLTGFLYDKTGVTGAWTLGLGLTALALSKEYYIINAEVDEDVNELYFHAEKCIFPSSLPFSDSYRGDSGWGFLMVSEEGGA